MPPQALKSVSGLDDPRAFYQVLDDPAPLAGMAFPQSVPWKSLAAAGFRSVVCLTDDTPPYNPSPLQILRPAQFEDLYGGRQPPDPKREAALLSDVAHAVASELRAGRGVVVHCQGGTGRTGTVIACASRLLGTSADAVLRCMARVNGARPKYPGWKGWPESEWQRRQVELPWKALSS